MKKTRRIIGGMLILLVVIVNIAGVGAYGAAIDKALVHVHVDERAHESAEASGLLVAEALESEGLVLLRNSGMLPLNAPLKINLLGCRAYDPVYSGSGLGGSAYLENRVSLVQALEDEGFSINPEVSEAYRKRVSSQGNTFKVDFSIDEYAAEAELAKALGEEYLFEGPCTFDAMRNYSDIAVIVIGRAGGEDNDLPVDMTDYAAYPADQSRHYLELNSAERSLLNNACKSFGTVIVLINTSNAMELGFLEEYHVSAALWIGSPGDVGMRAVAAALSGRINPSGRTVDTYPYAIESIPSYANFGEYAYTNTADLFDRKKNEPQTAFLVNYREGIYVGYRYFETRELFDYITREGETVQDALYSDVVQFPFGYGLSYTEFSWEVKRAEVPEKLTVKDTIRFSVCVTNIGERSGQPKHLAFNHQELNRSGVSTYFCEQAARENELRAFQGACESNEAQGIMTAFNRLGAQFAGAHEGMLIQVLRTEWGFLGWVTTDMINGPEYMNWRATVYAGGGNSLTDTAFDSSQIGKMADSKALIERDTAFQARMKEMLKYWAYNCASSSAINGFAKSSRLVYVRTWWQNALVAVDIGFAIMTMVAAAFYVLNTKKKKEDAV